MNNFLTMNKWDNLDEEFYNVIDNMTPEKWRKWRYNSLQKQKTKYQKEIEKLNIRVRTEHSTIDTKYSDFKRCKLLCDIHNLKLKLEEIEQEIKDFQIKSIK